VIPPFTSKQEPPHPRWCPIPHVCANPSSYRGGVLHKDRKFSSTGSQGGISGSARTQATVRNVVKSFGNTHALVLETFYNCECPRIMDILHNKPINCLLILAVDSSSFNELGFDAGNRIGMVVGI
jgi:hypothetical protein